jgi:hypothetical protein
MMNNNGFDKYLEYQFQQTGHFYTALNENYYHDSTVHPGLKGLPMKWQDDVTGNLPQAVVAYHNRVAQLMTDAELSLIIAYIQHYVHAPLWLNNIEDKDFREEILNIQKASLDLKTIKDVESIIEACMDVGWDPL